MKTSKTGYRKTSPDNKEKMLLIPSNNIDMSDTIHDEIYGIPYKGGQPMGEPILMKKGGKYLFKEADSVLEIPRQYMDTMKKGGMPKYQIGGGVTSPSSASYWGFLNQPEEQVQQNTPQDFGFWNTTDYQGSMLSVDAQGNPISVPHPGVMTPEQFNLSQQAETRMGQPQTPINTQTADQPAIGTIDLTDEEAGRISPPTLTPPTTTAAQETVVTNPEVTTDPEKPDGTTTEGIDVTQDDKDFRRLYNPYSSYDTRAAAYTMGRAIGGEESGLRGVAAGLKVGTSLLRDTMSGVGSANRAKTARGEYQDKQRRGMVDNYNFQEGGEVSKEEKEYYDFYNHLLEVREAIGKNDTEKLKKLGGVEAPYNANDLTKDYKKAQNLRNKAGLGIKEEAKLVFPHVGNQIRGTLNSVMGTNFQEGGAINSQDVQNINEGTGINFTDEFAKDFFLRAPQNEIVVPDEVNLGRYKDVNYFDVAQVTPDSITLNTTGRNPHNAQTVNHLIPELRQLNPNKNVKINYIPNRQRGGSWGQDAFMNVKPEQKEANSPYIEDEATLEFILMQEYNKLNPQNLPQNYKQNQEDVFNRDDVNLQKVLLELYNKNNKKENLPQMQGGGQLSTPERLTGEFIQGLPENKEEQGVVEVEDGEHILQPDGNMSEVKGDKHSQGGEKLSAEQIQEDSIVVSDHLKVGKENAAYFREKYGMDVRATDTYATVVDKIKKKTGLTKVNKEQEKVFKEIEKQEKNTEDPGTKNLNLEFLSKQVKELEEEKLMKEQEVKEALLDVYNKQEEGKPQEEQSPQINPDIINQFAEQNGIDPAQAGEIIQEFLKGGKYYNIPKKEDGGIITDPEKIKQIEEFKKTLHSEENFKNMFEEVTDEEGNKSYKIINNPEAPITGYDSDKWSAFRRQLVPTQGQTASSLTPHGIPKPELRGELMPGTPTATEPGEIAPMEGLADFSQTLPEEKRDRSQTDLFNMPDQSVMPPTSIQPPLKVETRLGRVDAARISPEQQLAENQRTFNAMRQQLGTLPPAQRAAAEASLMAEKTAADNQVMAATGAQNAQIAAQTDQINLRQRDAENVAAGQNALSYEDRMFKTQANYEENLQQYYDYMRNLNVAQFNDIRNQNTVNSMFEDYTINPDGSVMVNPNSELYMSLQNKGLVTPAQTTKKKS
jgi:hypothetical protein